MNQPPNNGRRLIVPPQYETPVQVPQHAHVVLRCPECQTKLDAMTALRQAYSIPMSYCSECLLRSGLIRLMQIEKVQVPGVEAVPDVDASEAPAVDSAHGEADPQG